MNLQNPLLKLELKSRLYIRKLIPAIILRLVFIGFIFLLILLTQIGKGLLAIFFSEAILFLLFNPGAVCATFSSDSSRRSIRDLTLTKMSPLSIFLGKLAGANFYSFIIIILSFLIILIASLFHKNLKLQPLIFAHIALIAIAFASSTIGLIFSVIFQRNNFTSALFAYIIILMLIGSVIIPGPVITRIKNQEIKSSVSNVALYISPFIMISRSLGNIDIMRTQYMYQIADPIVAPGFNYPYWHYAGVLYFGVSSLIFLPACLCFRYRYYKIDN